MEEANGFLGIGTPKAVKQSEGNLQNVFNYGMDTSKQLQGTGTATTNTGLGTLASTLSSANQNFNQARSTTDSALPFWQRIMSGNRPAMQQAVAPETNQVLGQTDALKRVQANLGTARGGGNAGTNQQANQDAMAKIDNLLFGARRQAAGAVQGIGAQDAGITASQAGVGTAVGGAEAQVGESQIAEALNALGIGSGATSSSGNIQNTSTANNQKAFGDFLSWAV